MFWTQHACPPKEIIFGSGESFKTLMTLPPPNLESGQACDCLDPWDMVEVILGDYQVDS